jgi:hypothetical protein
MEEEIKYPEVKLNTIFQCSGKLYSIAIPETASESTSLSGGREIFEFIFI